MLARATKRLKLESVSRWNMLHIVLGADYNVRACGQGSTDTCDLSAPDFEGKYCECTSDLCNSASYHSLSIVAVMSTVMAALVSLG